jgi:hypothetical protein
MKLFNLVLFVLSHFATGSSDFRFTKYSNDDDNHKTLSSLTNNQQRKLLMKNDNDELNEPSSHLGPLSVFSFRSCSGGTDDVERWEVLKKSSEMMTDTIMKGRSTVVDASDKTQSLRMSQNHYNHDITDEMMSGKVFDYFCGAAMLLCLYRLLFYFIYPSAVKVFFFFFFFFLSINSFICSYMYSIHDMYFTSICTLGILVSLSCAIIFVVINK